MPGPSTESRLVAATRGRWLLAAAAFLQYTAPWSFLLGLVILGETWRRGTVSLP